MNSMTIARTASLAVLLVTFAYGADKTPHTYLKGTITGWQNGVDLWGSSFDGQGIPREKTVFELKGTDWIYLIDYCGAFQAGQFGIGQAIDYRLDADRLYVRRDNGKEYKCKIEGQKILQGADTVAPPAKP
jgi:hypothetical protein